MSPEKKTLISRTAMTIKEELKEEVNEEGGGQEELEALDALEKEAAEYNKAIS